MKHWLSSCLDHEQSALLTTQNLAIGYCMDTQLKPPLQPQIAVFLVFLTVVLLFVGLEYVERQRYRETLQTRTINRLSQIRARLETEINANFYLTRGLIAYISTNPDMDEKTFQRLSAQLLKNHHFIRNIAVAPQNIIRFVHPLQGNEKAIGLNYSNNKEQWPAVTRAIATRKTVVAGPVKLVQGGNGFISRTPIFIAGNPDAQAENSYWGLASIVIEKEPLFRAAGLYDTDLETEIAIRGKDGLGAQGDLIEGNTAIFQNNPVLLPVNLPEGSWQLAAIPVGGWTSASPYLAGLRIFGLFLASLASWATFAWLKKQEKTRQSLVRAWQEAQDNQIALRQNEAFLNTVIDNIPAMIFVKDARGLRFIRFNQTGAKLVGYPAADLLGKTDYDFFPAAEARFFTEKDQEVLARGVLVDIPEEPIQTRDQGQKILHTRKIPIFDEQGKPLYLLGISEDITEQLLARAEKELLEKQLQQAQKLETIGKMAGGVAHDLNNILSGIINYPELLLLQLPTDSPLRKPIESIQDSGKRAAKVVADLLTIARGVAAMQEVTNLNLLINEYLNSPEYQNLQAAHPRISCTARLTPDIKNFCCSPVHIKKCLMNLVHNAVEAFPAGSDGEILIASDNCVLQEPLPNFVDMATGNFVRLTVTDNGPGISPHDLEHIFEPFYTKKTMGLSGTGLGLTVVWNTVKDHRGGITVESSNKGTVFTLFFPATQKKVEDDKAAIALEELRGQGQTILIVDDEPHQRDIASKILRLLNYSVTAVASGEEAIAYLKTTAADLILLDMVMGAGLTGRATYEAIIAHTPAQKAIIASGYTESEEITKIQALGAGQYVKKPYTLEQLGAAVREALSGL